MAGYLLSNKKLREELANVKDTEAAAKLLGAHLQRDGKKLAKQVQEFVKSDEVQDNLQKAKAFTQAKVDEAKQELSVLVGKGAAGARTTARNAAGCVKGVAKKGGAKAKKTAVKAKKQAKKAVRKTARRVQAKVRKLS